MNLSYRWFTALGLCLMTFLSLHQVLWAHASTSDGTIDPNNVGNQYAWSDQVGWVNFKVANPGDGPEIHITDSGITGYAWSQNAGWINMNPAGAGVSVNAQGLLSGSAWGENLGFISFSGVSINASGVFEGTATGTGIGTLSFDCSNCTVDTDYRASGTRGGRSRSSQNTQGVSEGSSEVSGDELGESSSPQDEQTDPQDSDGVTRSSAPEQESGAQNRDEISSSAEESTLAGEDSGDASPVTEEENLEAFLSGIDLDLYLPDLDGDGILNFFDEDIDGDGILNGEDDEIDLPESAEELFRPSAPGSSSDEGEETDEEPSSEELDWQVSTLIPLGLEEDFDGDFVLNERDPDLDGDGILNFFDEDIDGDGIPNELDEDRDQDGLLNEDDFQPNGLGIPDDRDGDRVQDGNDRDRDGDGIPNEDDPSDAYDLSPEQLRRRALLTLCIDHLEDLEEDKEVEAIRFLLEEGLFLCPETFFDPEGPVTRADAIKLNALSLGIENLPELKDVFWYSAWKRQLEERKILEKNIPPERYEGRVDFLAFVAKAKGLKLEDLPRCEYVTYLDVYVNRWYCPLVQYFEEKRWIERTPLFHPYDLATRSWAAGVIYRVFFTMP